jgi:hypothetical protein
LARLFMRFSPCARDRGRSAVSLFHNFFVDRGRLHSSHVPQILVTDLDWPHEQHHQEKSGRDPHNGNESIGYRLRVSLPSNLLA